MAEQLVFSQAAESLQRALGTLLSEKAKTRFKELGLDYSAPLESAYTLATWREVVNFAGELVAPTLPYEQQQFALGSRFITAYTGSVVGRALLTLMKLLGPRRALERMAKTLRTGNNYSETRLTMLEPQVYELWCNHVQNPSFYRGMIQTGLEHLGLAAVKVTTSADGGTELGATFRVSW